MTLPSIEVDDVMDRLAQLEQTIIDPVSGSALIAYNNVPYTISTADMPLFVNFVAPLTNNEQIGTDDAGREMRETRTYNAVLYHSPYASGIEGEKLGLLRPYFKLVYILFDGYPHLNSLDGVIDAKIVSDSGMGTVIFANQVYYGIRFTISVSTRVRRLYKDGD